MEWFCDFVIATVQSSEGENKHMCVPFGAYRVSRLVPCLDLASPAILPMGTSGLRPCTETLFGIISHNYCLSRLFKECRTHCDGGWDLGPGSRIFDGTGVANYATMGVMNF